MVACIILAALAGTFVAVMATLRVMVTRVDDACRLAELVRDTRRLRANHRAATAVPVRIRRR
jgi:hypothetical protein